MDESKIELTIEELYELYNSMKKAIIRLPDIPEFQKLPKKKVADYLAGLINSVLRLTDIPPDLEWSDATLQETGTYLATNIEGFFKSAETLGLKDIPLSIIYNVFKPYKPKKENLNYELDFNGR